MGIESWSTTASDNDAAPPNGAPEGMAPSGVNDTMRQIMASIRSWYENAQWIDFGHTPTRVDNNTLTIATDLTSVYHVGRRIKLDGGSTAYATISASSYSSPNTTIDVVMDSGNIPNPLTSVAASVLSAVNQAIPTSKFPDGSLSTPAISFLTDGDTGVYRHNSNDLRVTAGGNFIAGFQLDGSSRPLFFVADGVVAQPSICFSSDPDTGIYRSGSNAFEAVAGGAQIVRFTSTAFIPFQQIQPNDGSASTPIYSFNNDPDTGFWRAGSGQIAVSLNGVQSVNINSTAVDSGLLYYAPNGSVSAPSYAFGNDTNTGIYRAAPDTLSFAVGGTNPIGITTSAFDSLIRFIGPSSTSSAPTYTFQGDTDTGFYGAGSDQIGIATGGASRGVIAGGSFTGTLTGMSGSVTGTVSWIRYGDLVTLFGPTISGTSNAVTMTMTGLPSAIQTGSNSTGTVMSTIISSGQLWIGQMSVNGSTVTFTRANPDPGGGVEFDSTGFHNTGTKGLQQGIYGSYLLTA